MSQSRSDPRDFFTYAGVEVNAVHVDELRNPGREYPRSIFLAMALVLAVFIGPTLAIAWVIPSGQISFTAGVMQAFQSLFAHFGGGFAVPLIAIALAVGALAGMISWLDGPSEGLLRIGREQGFLPPYFQKVNGQGIEVRILAAQGNLNLLIYAVLILAGILAIGILPPLLMDQLRKPGWKAAGDGSA